jgi:hypothetical protein
VPVLGQVQLPRAYLGRTEPFGRSAEVTGEPLDLLNVGLLGIQREIADLHVLNHATAKRGHDQLLCEMNSATWRCRIVSRVRSQTRGTLSGVAASKGLMPLKYRG